jgi:hypothetical protein
MVALDVLKSPKGKKIVAVFSVGLGIEKPTSAFLHR